MSLEKRILYRLEELSNIINSYIQQGMYEDAIKYIPELKYLLDLQTQDYIVTASELREFMKMIKGQKTEKELLETFSLKKLNKIMGFFKEDGCSDKEGEAAYKR